jgi:hypothetical protein
MLTSRGGCLALAWLAVCPLLADGQTTPPAQAAPKAATQAQTGKTVRDDWDIAYLDGVRVGYVRLVVQEFTQPNGAKFLAARRTLSLTVRRGPDVARIEAVTGTDETPDGKVLGVFMQQGLGTQVQQTLRGTVQGNQLHITAEGKISNFDKNIPWNPAVLGTLGELDLLKKRKPKPGEKFDYLTFEPTIDSIVTVRVVVEKFEEVSIANQRPKLLQVTATPDQIAGAQLPSQLLWFDAEYEIRRTMTMMPGFGILVVERSDRAKAMQPLNNGQLPDIMERQAVKLSRRLPQAHALQSIVYRITLPNDRDPAKTFAQDERQTVRSVQGQTVEVEVQARRSPPDVVPTGADANPGPEFLQSNFFITSDDAGVKQHARVAVGAETDPWRKALLIEKWVNHNMKVQNFENAMVPAFKVAQTLTGDCTEFSMLAAAMCRAAGVPSRVAIGLVYVDRPPPRQAFFGFHMWTEVYVRGAWVAIDATLGQGSVGPGHLKIADHSWHDTPALTPLLPLMRVLLAQPAIEIVEAK